MPDFTQRSLKKELLDRDDIPFADIKRNMQELDLINSKLGGHTITIAGIKKIIEENGLDEKEDSITICEIGCGGGDNLVAILNWSEKQAIKIKCIGIDINPECIAFAKETHATKNIDFIVADYRDGLDNYPGPYIIFSSLFCHHFSEKDLTFMINWMKEHAVYGSMINDLHRHPLAYHSIKILTRFFSKSYLVKNDAPLSVLRGFKKNELEYLLRKAGIEKYSLQWKWAFRWLVTF